jgi:hypothetical protein
VRHFTFAFLLPLALCAATDCQVLFPADAKPIGPYSPGIRVGDTVYISGQGSRAIAPTWTWVLTPDGF